MRLMLHLNTLGVCGRAARAALDSGKVWYKDAPTADAARDVDPELTRYLPSAPHIKVGRDAVIVYRDQHLIVVWKPAGLLSVPAAGRRHESSIIGVTGRILGQELFPVHRLDELTSGLMVVARTHAVETRMRDMFAAHAIERRYMAIVRGVFPRDPITLRSIIVRDRGDGLRGNSEDTDDPTAKEAVTHVTLIEQLGSRAALVEARLDTGRTHQVRIHLSEMGYPVLGDDLYGGPAIGRALKRYALHAFVLGFNHPVGNKPLRFEAPLADDLERYLRFLRDPAQRSSYASPRPRSPAPRTTKHKRSR